jgi:phosphoserine phosphatase
MDGTLVIEDSSWAVIHRYFGTQEVSRHNLAAWDRGEIAYPEFMRRDIMLWQPVPTIEKIKEIF